MNINHEYYDMIRKIAEEVVRELAMMAQADSVNTEVELNAMMASLTAWTDGNEQGRSV